MGDQNAPVRVGQRGGTGEDNDSTDGDGTDGRSGRRTCIRREEQEWKPSDLALVAALRDSLLVRAELVGYRPQRKSRGKRAILIHPFVPRDTVSARGTLELVETKPVAGQRSDGERRHSGVARGPGGGRASRSGHSGHTAMLRVTSLADVRIRARRLAQPIASAYTQLEASEVRELPADR